MSHRPHQIHTRTRKRGRRRLPPTVVAFARTLLLALVVGSAQAFHFYLDAGTTRCFSDAAAPNTKILIEYTVSTGTGVMPVDLTVSLNQGSKQLLSQHDVEHGKVSFVLPYPEIDEINHIYHAEAKRRKHKHQHPQQQQQQQRRPDSRHLLAVHEDSKDSHGADLEAGTWHEPLDEEDDYDWINQEGIDDDSMAKDMNVNEAQHQKHEYAERAHDGLGDGDDDLEKEEEEIYSNRKFEICVANTVVKNEAKSRRIRLVIRKGNSALDYSRLAKNKHMSHLETSLKKIMNELQQLMIDLDRAQEMEKVLYKLNQGTNQQVVILSVICLVVLACVTGYQLAYTRQYFKIKKIA